MSDQDSAPANKDAPADPEGVHIQLSESSVNETQELAPADPEAPSSTDEATLDVAPEPKQHDGESRESTAEIRDRLIRSTSHRLDNFLPPITDEDLAAQRLTREHVNMYQRHPEKARHNQVTNPGILSKQEVMNMNGETEAMMKHVKGYWKKRDENGKPWYDTSVDLKGEEWCDESLKGRDTYIWVVTILCLTIKILALFVPMFMWIMVAMCFPYIYARNRKAPVEWVQRGCKFWCWFTICMAVSFPALIVAFLSLLVDYVFYYIFGFLFTLCTWRWKEYWASEKALDPYRGGPNVLLKLPDIFVCLMGQCQRHGLCGTSYMVVVMFLLMPWLKYFWNVNPWVLDLEERFVQQISTSMEDLVLNQHLDTERFSSEEQYDPESEEAIHQHLRHHCAATPHLDEHSKPISGTYHGRCTFDQIEHAISDTSRRVISRSRDFAEVRAREDLWNFAPHYPYPPPGRRFAIGMQAGGSGGSPIKFTLLVHTTHASVHGCDDPLCIPHPQPECTCAKQTTEQFVLSDSVANPVYRVMLWYNNPYHFLTGFVEASISNGGQSQQNKYLGGEHPMWLVTGHSPLVASRDSMTGVGMIDDFFDGWLPVFVHECRHIGTTAWARANAWTRKGAQAIGKAYADRYYQEVVSTDGFSRVRTTVGVGSDGMYGAQSSQMEVLRGAATSGALAHFSTNLNQRIVADDASDEEHEQGFLKDDFKMLQKRFKTLLDENHRLKNKNQQLKNHLLSYQ
eukprot:TRINITY_DN2492_c0_g4_i1.p1 TRINITY_DN2492_c0_g4~~TRINITY_DN2492_c0_g4_i1.p1  ORF type:complete len:739 (+),score=149.23 TRINITY_DN2492_c0_g4_i1:36-2252(+)